mmetsp:Transcript_19493/g.43427  ORF Transcript_19493/g.43427 Transcript_19493/m.43427 type:complete len:211 (-) Transcript_19493:510-1142(-)
MERCESSMADIRCINTGISFLAPCSLAAFVSTSSCLSTSLGSVFLRPRVDMSSATFLSNSSSVIFSSISTAMAGLRTVVTSAASILRLPAASSFFLFTACASSAFLRASAASAAEGTFFSHLARPFSSVRSSTLDSSPLSPPSPSKRLSSSESLPAAFLALALVGFLTDSLDSESASLSSDSEDSEELFSTSSTSAYFSGFARQSAMSSL